MAFLNNDTRQPKDEALAQAEDIRSQLLQLEGYDFGNGFSFQNGQLQLSQKTSEDGFLLGDNGEPVTLFHYRNLTNSTIPDNTDIHPLMHFGTLQAAYARAVYRRNLFENRPINNDTVNSEEFRLTTRFDHDAGQTYEGEVFFAVRAKIQNPFYMPDIGQTQFLRNRAVLYSSDLFTEEEIDTELFDEEGQWVENIDELVVNRLKERGYDSLAYVNYSEDPGSLSFVILDTNQIEAGAGKDAQYTGFRYRYGHHGDTKIVEGDEEGNISVKTDKLAL